MERKERLIEVRQSDIFRMILEAVAKSEQSPYGSLSVSGKTPYGTARERTDALSDTIRYTIDKKLLTRYDDKGNIVGETGGELEKRLADMSETKENEFSPDLARKLMAYQSRNGLLWACNRYVTKNKEAEAELVRDFCRRYAYMCLLKDGKGFFFRDREGARVPKDYNALTARQKNAVVDWFVDDEDGNGMKLLYTDMRKELDNWWKHMGKYMFKSNFLWFKSQWLTKHPEDRDADDTTDYSSVTKTDRKTGENKKEINVWNTMHKNFPNEYDDTERQYKDYDNKFLGIETPTIQDASKILRANYNADGDVSPKVLGGRKFFDSDFYGKDNWQGGVFSNMSAVDVDSMQRRVDAASMRGTRADGKYQSHASDLEDEEFKELARIGRPIKGSPYDALVDYEQGNEDGERLSREDVLRRYVNSLRNGKSKDDTEFGRKLNAMDIYHDALGDENGGYDMDYDDDIFAAGGGSESW